jgi:long-chain acyl-CoA synthetase
MTLEQYALSNKDRLKQDVWTVPAILQARAELSRDATALWSHETPAGTWSPSRWGEYRDSAARIAAALKHLKLAPGERVGILAPSSQRWDLLQMGVLAAQGVVVGLDPHDLDENLNSIAQRCNLAGLVVQDLSWLGRFGTDIRDQLRFVVHLDSNEDRDQGIAYEDLIRLADDQPLQPWHSAQPDAPATIIFTSGTSGAPKGIQYTHRQLCLAVASIIEAFPNIDEGRQVICWLPLSNMFQRIINLAAIVCGAQTYYVEDPRAIMVHIGSIEPYFFIGVPYFYEKLYAGMIEKINQGPAWQQAIIAWALRVGDSYAKLLRNGKPRNILQRFNHRLADYLVLQRLRKVMGGNLHYVISGSAPMPLWLLERFHAMGLLVLEAYGLSENVIPVAVNRQDAYRFGTVGHPLNGCEVRLADDGELLVGGPGVISSYYGEEQAGLLDSNGYLASGDYATIDADGFITLTGRKSEIIKTATGRRIAPAGIESFLLKVPSVESAAVIGAGRPYLVAVVVVSMEALGLIDGKNTEQSGLMGYCEQVCPEFVRYLAPLPEYKRPAGLVVTARLFSLEGGELTANLKLRRQNVAKRYAGELETLYRRLQRAKGATVLEKMNTNNGDIVLCSL